MSECLRWRTRQETAGGSSKYRKRRNASSRNAVWTSAFVLVSVGCTENSNLGPRRLPQIESLTVAPHPANVLSVIVEARVRDADSVMISYHLTGEAEATESLTPASVISSGTARVAALGLLPERTYALRLIAYAGERHTASDSVIFTTGALPNDLPPFRASGNDPTPGFVTFAVRDYGVVIDNTGRIVWYHRFPGRTGLSFAAQAGRYYARPNVIEPVGAGPWIEINVMGDTTRRLGCTGGMSSRPHDLIVEEDRSYWLLCDDTRAMDLTAVGGVANAQVTGTAVQHLSATDELLFEWSPFDHFELTDAEPALRKTAAVNWTHGNSLERDTDGNLLVSFRNLNELTKIDVTSGEVMWRMGGLRNQFELLDTPSPPFVHQHSVRSVGPGAYAILDNLGDSRYSRVEHYEVDAVRRTSRLIRSHTSIGGARTEIGGSVQSLPNGRLLTSFGTAGRVEEYDANGTVVWQIEGNAGYVFRAQRIRSLYAPGVGSTR